MFLIILCIQINQIYLLIKYIWINPSLINTARRLVRPTYMAK